MFSSFIKEKIEVSGTDINLVRGGEGPPLLLLHGYPQSHVMWHKVAPKLATKFTLVISDLRGYGDSGKPSSDDDHFNYSKRVTARDQVEVMLKLGYHRFMVAGHVCSILSQLIGCLRMQTRNSRRCIGIGFF